MQTVRTTRMRRIVRLMVCAIAATASGLSAAGTGQAPDGRDTALQQPAAYHNSWGLNILISNDGFGLGAFYRRELSEDFAGFLEFSISEAKDDQEVEIYDPYTGRSFAPGKLNRFLVIPLIAGVQYRLFREDIVDNFRPYVSAGVGPTMVYVMPYVSFEGNTPQEVDFFKAIGKGHPRYGLASYIGAGAMFGSDRSSVFGVNFRYYFTTVFNGGIPSLYDLETGAVVKTKKAFGGFAITLTFGMGY